MKYNKMIICTLVLLSLFSASCLIATYKINQDIKKGMFAPVANHELKEGLKARLEKLDS